MHPLRTLLAVFAICLCAVAAPPVARIQLRRGEYGADAYVVAGSVQRAAVAPEGAGLVFGMTDEANYSLVWVDSDGVALWRQADGEWERLAAETLEGIPEAVRVEALCESDGALVLIDGRVVLRAALSVSGRAGAASSGAAELPDEVSVREAPRPTLAERFMDPDGKFPGWTPLSGEWRADTIQDPWLELDEHPPKASRYRGSGDEGALSVTGRPTWHGYAAQVATQFVNSRNAGLVFGFRDQDNYAFLRLGEDGAVLGMMEDGEERVAARKAMDVRPEVWYPLRAVFDHDRIRAYVGRVLVGEAPAGSALGRAGVQVAAGGDAIFDEFNVMPAAQATDVDSRYATLFHTDFASLEVPGERRNEVFRVVGDILRPERGSAWRANDRRLSLRENGSGNLWFKDQVRGDAAIALTATLSGEDAALALVVADDRDGGYALRLRPDRAEIRRNGETVAEKGGVSLSEPTEVRFWRDGKRVLASLGGTEFGYEDAEPLNGGRVGVQGEGPVEIDSLEIGHDLAATYRFDEVEPDWRPSAGTWLEHNGMTCIAWSYWIGAEGTPDALLWNPFVWPEHFTAQVWVSEATDGDRNRTHVHHPYHSVQFIVAGDGASLDKGYRFSIAEGPRKDTTRLYRNGEVVAETRQFGIVMGGHSNRPRTFLARVRRDGATLTLWADGRRLIEYTDADPLGPGLIAFGTQRCRADFKDFAASVDKPWLSDGLPAVW